MLLLQDLLILIPKLNRKVQNRLLIDIQINRWPDFLIGLGHQRLAHNLMLKLADIFIHKNNIALEGILIEGHKLDRNDLFLAFADLNHIFITKKGARKFLLHRFLLLETHFLTSFSYWPLALLLIFDLFRFHIVDHDFVIGVQMLKDIFDFYVHFLALVERGRAIPGANRLALSNPRSKLKNQRGSLHVALLLVGKADSELQRTCPQPTAKAATRT